MPAQAIGGADAMHLTRRLQGAQECRGDRAWARDDGRQFPCGLRPARERRPDRRALIITTASGRACFRLRGATPALHP